jgi:DNA-binding LytR/AlgR family response regulator
MASRPPRRSRARSTWSSSPAHDEYAIRAFEQGAIDYLLKPAEPERLALTCERLRARLKEAPDPMSDLLAQLSQRLGGER